MTDSAHFDTYLQVRLTTHDKERIKARALEAGLKTSEYVRKRALGERVGPNQSAYAEALRRGEDPRTAALSIYEQGEAQASVALDGETMYEGHPAVKRAEREQAERNARGAVVEHCETTEG